MRNQLKNYFSEIIENPQKTSNFFAFSGTVLFWLILLFVLLFSKPMDTKSAYKEVQIVLSSTPVKKQESVPSPAAEVSSPVEQVSEVVNEPSPVEQVKPVEKVVEKPEVAPAKTPEPAPVKKETVKKTEPKTESVKTVPSELVEYAMDMSDFSFNNSTQTKKKVVDWDSMFSDDVSEETSAEPVKKLQTESSFSGSAATKSDVSEQSVTSSTVSSKNQNQNVSESTSSMLKKISDTSFTEQSGSGVSSQTNVKSAVSSSGKVIMEMSNGSSRVLLDPAKPIIFLSDQAAASIDGSRTVKIRFRVLEQGNIPRGEIKITPESVLTDIVKSEILDQISKWRFEPDDYSAFAEFEYKIVKK